MEIENLLKILPEKRSSNLEFEFRNIAVTLFENFAIVKNTQRYCLTDIEFYLLAPWHQDYYTLGKEGQLSFGKLWYNSFGIDLTMGDPNETIWGGILIRGVIEMDTYRPITGCWNVYRELGGTTLEKDENTLIRNGLEYTGLKCRNRPIDIISKKRKGLNPGKFELTKAEFIQKYPQKFSNEIDHFIERPYRFVIV